MIIIPIFEIRFDLFLNKESNLSLVQTKISESSIELISPDLSPMASATFSPTTSAISFNSSYFSLANALRGTT